MESPSLSSPFIDEKEKKNRNLLIYMCMWIHKFTFKIFHENNISVNKKVTLNPVTPMFIQNKYYAKVYMKVM
jgi:hypothetical protein